jgi:hypothetical protein
MNILKNLSSGYDKTKDFLRSFVVSFWGTIKNYFHLLIRHAEALTILLLAATGLTYLLSQMPQLLILPTSIEIAMLPQVAAVAIISLLISSIVWRNNKWKTVEPLETASEHSA